MRMIPHHRSIPIQWSLTGLRQIMGQEIAQVVGDSSWTEPLPGSEIIWQKLRMLSTVYPRIATWQGPWLLLSDPSVLAAHVAAYGAASDDERQVLREMAWFWRALGWSHYSTPTCYAVQSFLILDVWPPEFWKNIYRLPPHPVRDWLRLERRVLFLRTAIDGAAAGHATIRWGHSTIDCRVLLADPKVRSDNSGIFYP